ncbi:MAG: pyruvate formate lyase family protein [Bacillota bacterium]
MSEIKQPKNLTPRIEWLRNYYFEGVKRPWNNEYKVFTTGEEYDEIYNELTYYIVPETYAFFNTFKGGLPQIARKIEPPEGFYKKSIAERRAWFIKEAIVNRVPKDVLPGDLLAGSNFNVFASHCHTKKENKERAKILYGKDGLRQRTFKFHERGFGNCGATSGHLIPDYATIVQKGFKYIIEKIDKEYKSLSKSQKRGHKGAQLRAMREAATMPCELAKKYSQRLKEMAKEEKNKNRKLELETMAKNLEVVPYEPATDFWQAVQSLWLTHMLVMTDENYPGPGVSFGRLDQYLYPYYKISKEQGMTDQFMKEILECMWVHCNTVYDAQIKVGANQGITAGFGQLFMISGVGDKAQDMTNELSYLFLDVIDEMSPILEPKPNIRLHKNTPDKLLKRIVDMVGESQGAPFLLNFDERSMAGLLRQAKKSGKEKYINKSNVWDYAAVGCMENTMVGNDRSGTVDININLLKAMELTLGKGYDMKEYKDILWGKVHAPKKHNDSPDPETFETFEDFYKAFEQQTRYIVAKIALLYDESETVRAKFHPTPYLSCLVKGCIEKAKDITKGGAELRYVTVEGVTFATTVDSLLAVKYLVYDKKVCSMKELIKALKNNWKGNEKLQMIAKNKAPKYGRDDDNADEMARKFMEFWSEQVWKYKTTVTDVQMRPGMLSWNYWVGDGYILAASPDGRKCGQFLSNAICPSNGADINGPTSNINSAGKALGGKDDKSGDYQDYINYLPNGASHTITLSPSLMRDDIHKEKLMAFLKAYVENGGTALQINVLDVNTLIDAQKNPSEYKHLLVRVTGYNAYFTSIGRELQNEIIAREVHNKL